MLNGDPMVPEGVCTGLLVGIVVVMAVTVGVAGVSVVVLVVGKELGTGVLVVSGIEVDGVTDMSGLSKVVVVKRMLGPPEKVREMTWLSVGVELTRVGMALGEGVIRLVIDVTGTLLIVVDAVGSGGGIIV